jgi:predicted RNase H-like nuclease (RuvC/YqgF family)
MSKNRDSKYSSKESFSFQRLKHELEKLKRENSRLKKQLQHLDVNRYQDIHELVIKDHEENTIQSSKKKTNEQLKKEWHCYKCEKGYLKIRMLSRLDGIFYYRKCSNEECPNRTKTQKYTSDVRGIKDEEED